MEPIAPVPKLYLFGAGQTAVALHHIAHVAGFEVTIVDEYLERLNAERFPFARRLLGTPSHVCVELAVDHNSYIVIMTRAHSEDMNVLRWAATTAARYVGMIGEEGHLHLQGPQR